MIVLEPRTNIDYRMQLVVNEMSCLSFEGRIDVQHGLTDVYH